MKQELEKTQDYWFKPKRHGYGATPSNWKGWVATLAFSFVAALGSIAVLVALTDQSRLFGMLAWVVVLLIAVMTFSRFARTKTDGPWGWRWNGKLYRDMFEASEPERKDCD